MRITVIPKQACFRFVAGVALALLVVNATGHEARAEGAFVEQARAGAATRSVTPASPQQTQPTNYQVPRSVGMPMTPESMASRAGGGNFASTLEVGSYNRVLQAQLGAGNVSNVGILKGIDNNVGVLQAGNNLKSNLVLLNTTGLSVGVIQPNGSAPVNMLIARLPNGGLLIKR